MACQRSPNDGEATLRSKVQAQLLLPPTNNRTVGSKCTISTPTRRKMIAAGQ